jgi:hypothetical protein
MHAALTENRVVVRGGLGISLENGAKGQFLRNAIIADIAPLSFSEADEAASVLEREVLVPADDVRGAPSLGDETKALTKVLADAGAPDALKALRDAAIDRALDTTVDRGGTVEGFFADLEERLHGLEDSLAQFGAVSLLVTDAAGRSLAAPFSLFDANRNEVAKTDWEAPTAKVAAGDYFLVPDFDPLAEIAAPVAAGEENVVRLTEAGLWLTVDATDGDAAVERQHLVELLPPAERAALVAALRFPSAFAAMADRRPDASPEDMAAALALARAWLQGGNKQRETAMGAAADSVAFQGADRLAYRILALAGDASDVAWLAAPNAMPPLHDPLGIGATAAALIEARLGQLETGHFAEEAQKGEGEAALAAALLLHRFGIRDHDDVAISAMLAPADPLMPQHYDHSFMTIMADRGGDEMLAVVRLVWERYQQRAAELAAMTEAERQNQYNEFYSSGKLAQLYLLAHGGPDDWRRAAEETVDRWHVSFVAAMVADLAKGEKIVVDTGEFSAMLEYLDHVSTTLSEAETAQVQEVLSGLVYQAAYAAGIRSGEDPQQRGLNYQVAFDVWSAPASPNTAAGGLYYRIGDGLGFENPEPWLYYDWAEEQILTRLLTPGSWDERDVTQLDYVPHERLVAILSEKGAANILPSAELLVAYHKVAKRAQRIFEPSTSSSYFSERPAEGRAFAFSVQGAGFGFEGAITGRLDIEPFFIGPVLHIRLKPRVAESYKSGSLIDFGGPEAERHHGYGSEPRTLISGVRVRRGSVEIETEPSEDRNGPVFVARLDARDLRDLWVDVDLGYFDKRQQLTYPLYFGPFAAAERIRRAQVSAAEALAAASPDDPNSQIALARAQRASGEPEKAWTSFAAALERDPALFDLWFEAADMFAAAGMPGRAVEVLDRALQSHPGDPDLSFALGAHAYDAGDYTRAARAFGALTAASPEDSEARMWLANALFLQGDWSGAAEAFAALPADSQSPWIAMRRLIAAAEANGPPLADVSAFDTTRSAMAEIEQRVCDDDFYGAYRARLTQQDEAAVAGFDRARSSCAYGSFERRVIAELIP